MFVRLVLVVFVVGLLSGATAMSLYGVWGETSSVVSTRAGSPGGGYGVGGRIK